MAQGGVPSDKGQTSSFLQEAVRVALQFNLTATEIQQMTDHFVQQLDLRLQDENANSTQLPSFVSQLPTGREKGVYLAADLGGTNLRVSIVTLHGNGQHSIKQSKTAIPQCHMVCDSHRPLFAFVADYIKSFVQSHLLKEAPSSSEEAVLSTRHALSFSFSFTVEQTSLCTGKLLRWDKGFDLPSAIGLDPCALLQYELDAIEANVQVAALANDAVGTLLAQQYISGGQAVVGAIFGTGTNGAYAERLANVTKIRDRNDILSSARSNQMVMNVEWGALDDESRRLPLTEFDKDLDRRSLHPGEQIYEKMVSGMYLGEMLRTAVLTALRGSNHHVLNRLTHTAPLLQEWSFSTATLSLLTDKDRAAQCVQQDLGIESPTKDEIEGISILANAIGQRAARLSGVSIAAAIIRTKCLEDQDASATPRVSTTSKTQQSPFMSRAVVLSGGLLYSWHRILTMLSGALVQIMGLRGSRILKGKPHAKSVFHVGLDGSVATLYPGFVRGVRRTFEEVAQIGPQSSRIQINLIPDASSMGSALIAQAACQ